MYGLIDCEYALQNYHEYVQQYHAPEAAVEEYEIDSNMDALLCLDEETVEGFWKRAGHEKTAQNMYMIKKGDFMNTNAPGRKKRGFFCMECHFIQLQIFLHTVRQV